MKARILIYEPIIIFFLFTLYKTQNGCWIRLNRLELLTELKFLLKLAVQHLFYAWLILWYLYVFNYEFFLRIESANGHPIYRVEIHL